MDLLKYFTQNTGTGVLATSDEQGRVDLALYAPPHIVDPNTLIFVMKQRLSHQNLKSNLHAAYLFLEDGKGLKGLRLYLTMIREEINTTLAAQIRKKYPEIYPPGDDSIKFVVFFQVDRIRPLVGDYIDP